MSVAKSGARIAQVISRSASLHAGYDLGFALPAGTATFARGLVRVDPRAEAAALGALTYTLALARNAAPRALTFETPSRAPWETRLAMHRAAVLAAIAGLSQTSG